MKSKTFSVNILLLLTAVILCISSITFAQTQKKPKKQKQETPAEKFYRLGGKETKVKVIQQGYELTTFDISEKRDLTLYDGGGHFNCRDWVGAENAKDVNCDFSQIRDFIWQHWQNKQRGYIRVTLDSVDAVSTAHIFIEPNKNGTWRIKWRWVRHLGEITDLPDIVALEQSKPEKWEKEGGTFVLVFKYAEGENIRL